jgi:hypothetical protein
MNGSPPRDDLFTEPPGVVEKGRPGRMGKAGEDPGHSNFSQGRDALDEAIGFRLMFACGEYSGLMQMSNGPVRPALSRSKSTFSRSASSELTGFCRIESIRWLPGKRRRRRVRALRPSHMRRWRPGIPGED